MIVEFSIPIKTISEANSHTHWRVRQKRAKSQRHSARTWCLAVLRGRVVSTPIVVTITRIGPRVLDSDNLVGSQKAARDGIADALGIDDGSPLIEWRYKQSKGPPKTYGVQVRIESVESFEIAAQPPTESAKKRTA